ncbi:hypothetical protein BDM02DRAFT_417759 [Thelephora ganbajun]|uniref:Uncharacterized protein n=1 Tax=Thelephora ganbajun TaxID=370292 RepID=A0ACB6Z7Z3_THEGA|nr:hypothetical protein BDM02DRAFT_417759 [Thelephora ganbajun]
MADGGYNGLKAFAFTVGVTVLIFTILYVAKRYNPDLFGQESFSRNYAWYFSGPNDPPETRPNGRRWPLGEKPRMWDVWIASWYPFCSQSESRSEKLDVSRTANDQRGSRWREFLPLSADKVSDADATVPPLQVKGDNTVQSTSLTQIRISTVILMPVPPRPTSLASTSSPNPPPDNIHESPGEYALGTSYIPYTPED